MAINVGMDGWRVTICPACGYPSAGLCAACIQFASAGAVEAASNTSAAVSHFNPAA